MAKRVAGQIVRFEKKYDCAKWGGDKLILSCSQGGEEKGISVFANFVNKD